MRTINTLPDTGDTTPVHEPAKTVTVPRTGEDIARELPPQRLRTPTKKTITTKTVPGKKKDETSFDLPPPKWPVSIRDEQDDFEDVIHPGDGETVIPLPKFWSGPLNDGELMSPELAAHVGSYTDGSVDENLTHKNDPSKRTIFVAIASYRDWQCRYTVESILLRAKYPERVRVAVVDQVAEGDASCGVPIKQCGVDPYQALCQYSDNVDVVELDAILAVGPVFARHIGHRMYRGEYYAMQVDAHVDFVTDWDVDIIRQIESSNNEMAVLSTYLTDVQGAIDKVTGASLLHTRPIMCSTDYEGGPQGKHLRHMQQPEREPPIKGQPQLHPYWAAGYSFSRGHFLVNVPYDFYQPMIFQGEEIGVGIRGFTYGYDFYAPERSICFHAYAVGANAAKRGKVKHFWEHSNMYAGVGIGSMKRLIGIIEGSPEVDPSEWNHAEEKRYGLGKVRTPAKFYETFGIDVVRKKAEQNLCAFVQGGTMHRRFVKQLRPDGMGIDYSKIVYKFENPGLNAVW
mmetsp:Transcript_58372/g.69667  ORF Transcript_58372/g.69667 Transcript_58372/m.69667 type:complete len:513 (+) Transcript_58372:320-1858(+)